jgi:hypothetical protein
MHLSRSLSIVHILTRLSSTAMTLDQISRIIQFTSTIHIQARRATTLIRGHTTAMELNTTETIFTRGRGITRSTVRMTATTCTCHRWAGARALIMYIILLSARDR